MDSAVELPEHVLKDANKALNNLVPNKSRVRYEKAYNTFKHWQVDNNIPVINEIVLLAYFQQLSSKHSPSSLWVYYSMLRSTIGINDNIDIKAFQKLYAFLKRQNVGNVVKKSKVLSDGEYKTFLIKARDEKYLLAKDGSVSHIAISPDEKIVAISTSRGLVVLVNNCFSESNVQYHTYTEHKGNSVTAMKWQSNDLYCGDSLGNVSVISLTSILSKAIFQPPSATLMHLGSSIVQLDAYSKFLLVSTKTKSYLCDTQEEQYRQIGKKLRDGDFGACFYPENPDHGLEVQEKEKSIFKVLKEGEKFAGPKIDGVKIYSTRPGLRLWEANFEASVVCTHQFRDTASQAPCKIIQLGTDENSRLKIARSGNIKGVVNFGRAYILSNKFLLTFISSNIFVFDAQGVNLLYRYSLVEYIRDVKIYDNHIYVWDKNELKILMLLDLESLLLKTLANKQYYSCAEICVKYNKEVVALIGSSQKIQSLTVLKEKLTESDIMEKLMPILAQIREIKPTMNGIVKVENGHVIEASCSYEHIAEKVKSFSNNLTLIKETKANQNDSEGNKIPCSAHTNLNEAPENLDPTQDPNYVLNVLHRQYQVNKMYSNIEMPQVYELLSTKKLEDIVEILRDFITHIKQSNEDDDVERWCHVQYLKYVIKFYDVKSVEPVALAYIFEAFKSVNASSVNLTCDCTFPLPNVKNFKSDFYDVGCEIYNRLPEAEQGVFRTAVPYMWRLRITESKGPVAPILPLLVQFSDLELLRNNSIRLGCDHWDDALCLVAKLKRNICLNCEKRVEFDVGDSFAWRDFAAVMVRSIGPVMGVKLMQRYPKFIPNWELGADFYQTCIFSAIANDGRKAGELMDGILKDHNLSHEFDRGMNRYLNGRYTGSIDIKPVTKPNFKCSFCDLPLQTPILCNDVSLACGHTFHKICADSIRSICCVCDVQPK